MVRVILCYGGSNTRGFIPGSFDEKTWLHRRYPKDKRWTGVLQKNLGSAYEVIEEGLAGRTTNLDELNPNSIKFSRNGLKEIWSFMDTHYPLDLVILDLGTNDTKAQFNRSSHDIADGMRKIVQSIKSTQYGHGLSHPKVMVLLPLQIGVIKDPLFAASFNQQAMEKSKKLPILYQEICIEEKADFLDMSKIVKPSAVDGMHLDESQHYVLGQEVAKKVTAIFNARLI